MAQVWLSYWSNTEHDMTEHTTSDEVSFGKYTAVGIAGVGFDGNNTSRAVNFLDPSGDQDLATKAYVDAVAQGLKLKDSCKALSDADVTLSGAQTIDNISCVDGDRVLLTNQGTGSENGIWIVRTSNWERPDDYDTGSHAASSFTFIEQGDDYADSGWVCTTDGPNDVVDTDATAWTQFSGAGSITAGAGLDKSGNTIFIGNGAGILVNADSIEVELATNPGLKFDAAGVTGKLQVDVGTGANRRGLDTDANGLHITPASSNPGLYIDGNQNLDTKLNANGGIQSDSSGLEIKIDDTPDTLDVDSDGLKVVGLPSLFKINDTAVGATVTATNLDSLTDGSVITTLHTHDSAEFNKFTKNTSENLSTGDPVCMSSTADQFAKGDAGNSADARIIGVSDGNYTSPNAATIITSGPASSVLGGSGVANQPYYLANGGGLTSTPPTGSGNRVVLVGYGINTNDLFVQIDRKITRNN